MIAFISISSCEKEEVFEEAQNELIFPEIKGKFVKGKDLLQIPIIGDKINSLSSNMFNKSSNSSGIQIDTSRIQVIESVDYKSYTFQIVQDSVELQSLLRNYMITVVNDTTTIQHLINYEILPSGDYNMDNIQLSLVTGDSLIPDFLKCNTGIFEATFCYDVLCDRGGNHGPGEACRDGQYRGIRVCGSRAIQGGSGTPCRGGNPGSGPGAGNGGSSVVIPVVPVDEDDDCNTSKDDLKGVFPSMSDTNAELLKNIINDKGLDFGIDTKEKLQHFLSQCGHETGGFTTLQVSENLNYSPTNLTTVWPNRFSQTDTTKLDPDDYKYDAEKLANYVYGNRMGNGNETSGDGWKYRGRGIKQLTGKSNYQSFKTWYNSKYDPDKDFVSDPNIISNNDTVAILSGMWFYKKRVLDKITIDSTTTVEKVTKKINGGTVGLSSRETWFNTIKDTINCK
jgi:putative chitinase